MDAAIAACADYEEWFVREVNQGLESLEKGKSLSHEEVEARVKKILGA